MLALSGNNSLIRAFAKPEVTLSAIAFVKKLRYKLTASEPCLSGLYLSVLSSAVDASASMLKPVTSPVSNDSSE